MGLFHRKKDSDKAKEDRELISANERAIEALIVLAEQAGNAGLQSEFKNLREKLKYLIPSENEKVYDYDKKIRNGIDDLRIAIVKNDGETDSKANKLLTQIKLLIADRNSKV